jgi:hypothetical protein
MRFVPLLLLAACATEPSGDVTGPYTGPTHRFVVDAIDVPLTNTKAREYADDLDGNKTPDNQLGMVLSTLSYNGNLTTHGADMIAAGAISSSVEIVAHDLQDDSIVSVLYRGAPGEQAVAVGGSIEAGTFRSNRTATTEVPGSATLHLPVFVDSDPVAITLEGMEIDLVADGHGGFDGWVRGVVDPDEAKHAAYLGAAQMIAADPNGHMFFMRLFDTAPRDWQMSEAEFVDSSLIKSLFEPDVTYRNERRLSFAFRIHLSPCESGRCAAAPADACHDRVIDGNEIDVDCGGSCDLECPDGGRCVEATDCDSGSCNGATCEAATCTDGVRNGFETDVDCGSTCGPCAVGQQCFSDSDCGTGHSCGAPCTETLCIDEYDHCQ